MSLMFKHRFYTPRLHRLKVSSHAVLLSIICQEPDLVQEHEAFMFYKTVHMGSFFSLLDRQQVCKADISIYMRRNNLGYSVQVIQFRFPLQLLQSKHLIAKHFVCA